MESTGCCSEGVAEFFHKLGFKVSGVSRSLSDVPQPIEEGAS